MEYLGAISGSKDLVNKGYVDSQVAAVKGAFIAEYGTTTYSDVKDAWDNEQNIVCQMVDGDMTYLLPCIGFDDDSDIFAFCSEWSAEEKWATLASDDTWDDYNVSIAQVQADWDEASNISPAYIQNKPTIPSNVSDLNNDSGFITSPNVVYCTCGTATSTVAKVATIVSGSLTTLTTGCQAIVKFTYANSATNPTLQVGTTTAKNIKKYGSTAPGTSAASSWQANSCILFVYDGTDWQMCDWNNTTYSAISQTNIENSASTSTGLITGQRAAQAVAKHESINDVTVGGTSVVSSKVAVIPAIPTDTSDLTNTAGYITSASLPTDFVGTDGVDAGAAGLVPAPTTSDAGKYLKSDGTWATVSSGSSDYTDLTNKPTINSVTLSGNKTAADLGINEIYWATKGTTTSAQIEGAYQAGKTVCVFDSSKLYVLAYRSGATDHRFVCNYGASQYELKCSSDAWTSSNYTFAQNSQIPTVNNATLTIQKNGTTVNTFTANASSNVTADISVPTKVSDLTNDSGFISSYTETDPVFTASAAYGIASGDITSWNGKSTVSINRKVSTGTNIADITIDGTTTELYAPTGGGGSVTDVQQNGVSVMNGTVAEVSATLVQIVRW